MVENEINYHFNFFDIDITFYDCTFKTHTYHKLIAIGLYATIVLYLLNMKYLLFSVCLIDRLKFAVIITYLSK